MTVTVPPAPMAALVAIRSMNNPARGALQARHPGITPVVLSLSSPEIETSLERLSLDLGLGYIDRLAERGIRLTAAPQYTERYFLVRRALKPSPDALRFGPTMTWAQAARLPLCLLTPEMHNRTLVNAAFAAAGEAVKPVIETNSILTLMLCVSAGQVCSIVPGALAVVAGKGIALTPLQRTIDDGGIRYGFVSVDIDRTARIATISIKAHQPKRC